VNRPTFDDLVRVMATLRGPGGCPWDREQTHTSLRPYLLEEAYEVLEAIDAGDPDRLREELGDLLLQVVFHSQIAAEHGQFTVHDVVASLHDKLVRRHPHVFAGVQGVDTPEQVKARWEAMKRAERPEDASALDGVPASLPALVRAQKLYRRASEAGFEWPDARSALEKVREELGELEEAVASRDPAAVHEEVGDVLMTVAKVAAFAGVDAEQALRDACGKFTRRFRSLERLLSERGQRMEQLSLPELEHLWKEAKHAAG
jgi:tetrapyrrole methylase family protein/MazG family protein